MGDLYGGREAEVGRSLKSKRVQESRDRESAEGSKNSRRIVELLLSFFPFFFQVVFSQSQGQGWERGSRGDIGHRRIEGHFSSVKGGTLSKSLILSGIVSSIIRTSCSHSDIHSCGTF